MMFWTIIAVLAFLVLMSIDSSLGKIADYFDRKDKEDINEKYL